MRNHTKILSVLLSMILALSVFAIAPVGALAAEADPEDWIFLPDATEDEASSDESTYDEATQDERFYESTVDERYPDFEYKLMDCHVEMFDGDYPVGDVFTGAVVCRYTGDETDVVIPDELGGYPVGGVAYGAFYENERLEAVSLPAGAVAISSDAFYGCDKLSSVSLNDGLLSISSGAFSGCRSLKNILLPDSVEKIGQNAFRLCTSLEEITLPASLETLEMSTFAGCTALRIVNIPASVSSIERVEALNIPECDIFARCSAIEAFHVAADNPDYTSVNGVLYTKDRKKLVAYPSAAETVTIPDTVEVIGQLACAYNPHITSVTIPDSVYRIESAAFAYCPRLSEINTSERSIDVGADIAKKTAWAEQGGLLCLGGCVIGYGPDLPEELVIPDNVTSISEYAFAGRYEWEESEDDEGNYIYDLVAIQANIKTLTIPESVTFIGDRAFNGCSELRSVTIDAGDLYIDHMAFAFCEKLQSVAINGGRVFFGERLFSNDGALTDVTLNYETDRIACGMFYHCDALTSIELPAGVTRIESSAFKYCGSLSDISFAGGIEQITNVGCGAFAGTPWLENLPEGVVYIGGAAYTYNGATPDEIAFRDGTVSITPETFSGCETLQSVIIPEGVTQIEADTFSAYSLRSAVIPAGTVLICDDSFFGYSDELTIYGYSGSEAESYAMRQDYHFIPIGRISTDKETGISAGVSNDMALAVEPLSVEDQPQPPEGMQLTAAYDISLYENGQLVQPYGKISVMIPCCDPSAKVYRLEADGSYTDMHAGYMNDLLVFTADHFSIYLVATGGVGSVLSGRLTTFGVGEITLSLEGDDYSEVCICESDCDGYFFENIPDGDYVLTAEQKDHVTREYRLIISGDAVQDVELRLLGDINGDGVITTVDFGRANSHARGKSKLKGYEFSCADVNGDKNVTTADAGRINSHARGRSKLW